MRTYGAALAGSLVALLLACTKAEDVKCQPGYGLCGAGCVSLLDDERNCGACGNACGASQTCTAGACVTVTVTPACSDSLRVPIRDRWGTSWDGLERSPATQAEARAACGAFGGRLPIATEIHRVSWAHTGDVGQLYHSNPLWTLVPVDTARHFMVAMADGASAASDSTVRRAYRCVCPAAAPTTFSGYACSGPAGDACFALAAPNAGYNMDKDDRALLSVGGAVWECAFAGGQLARFGTYVEAILEGLPNGTNEWLHTADLVNNGTTAELRWTGTQVSWLPETNTGYYALDVLRPFRCVGRAATSQPSSARPTDAFVGVGALAADAADRAASSWAPAHGTCWAAGGHVPFPTELGALVQQGLGGGSGQWLWTADEAGYLASGDQFLANVTRWTSTQYRFYAGGGDVEWAYKTNAPLAHRCVYYPVDGTVTAPTTCNGGCATFALPGSGGATMWIDSQDRDAATFVGAVGICRGLGAHLASGRDLTEAVRASLPNGSNAWLWTSDVGMGVPGPVRPIVKRWNNVAPGFTDLYSAYMTWSDFPNSNRFRCMWTNEVR